jgi:hypothetical protein
VILVVACDGERVCVDNELLMASCCHVCVCVCLGGGGTTDGWRSFDQVSAQQ